MTEGKPLGKYTSNEGYLARCFVSQRCIYVIIKLAREDDRSSRGLEDSAQFGEVRDASGK